MTSAAAWSAPAPATEFGRRPPAAALADHVACGWTIQLASGTHRLAPDGCVDLLWISNGRLVVCGPETGPWTFALPAGTTAAGLRLRPGRAPAVLGTVASELLDRRVALEDLWGRAATVLGDRLADAASGHRRIDLLEAAVRARLVDAPPSDPVARSTVQALTRYRPGQRAASVERLAEDFGLSARQLHRRAVAAFGYGPAFLARILRFQRFAALAAGPRSELGLAALAGVAGYTDQSHLARDVRSFADTTPAGLLAEAAAGRRPGLGGALGPGVG